jgi:RimJ/RimL family protein N-acetyltransferase
MARLFVDQLALGADASISTKRLQLVPLEQKHAENLFSVLSDETLYEFIGGAPPASVAELRARWALLEARRSPDRAELWLNWAASETITGKLIGWFQATVTADHADVAWVVGTLWQRHGYATEAAQALISWLRAEGVSVIRAKVHPRHTASQRVAANVGLLRTPESIEGEEVWVG